MIKAIGYEEFVVNSNKRSRPMELTSVLRAVQESTRRSSECRYLISGNHAYSVRSRISH